MRTRALSRMWRTDSDRLHDTRIPSTDPQAGYELDVITHSRRVVFKAEPGRAPVLHGDLSSGSSSSSNNIQSACLQTPARGFEFWRFLQRLE